MDGINSLGRAILFLIATILGAAWSIITWPYRALQPKMTICKKCTGRGCRACDGEGVVYK